MTRKVATCGEDDTVATIMERMTEGKFRHMPVVEQGRLDRHRVDRRRGQAARRGNRAESPSDARLHPDRLDRPISPTGRCRRTAATARRPPRRSRRCAFSVASAPISIASAARWKSNQPMRPSRGLISTSGGSPASRARVMRSCMTLNASIITVGMPGRPRRPTNCRRSERSPLNRPRKPFGVWRRRFGGCVVASSEPWLGDDGAAAEQVGVEIDRDDEPRAERARGRHRHRIDQRAVDQPAPADQHRRENSRQRVGGAHRVDQPAAGEPDFVAGAELGGDGGKADRQLFDRRVAELLFEPRREMAAADQAGAGQADVEIAEDAAHGQAARPFLDARRAGRAA